MGQPDAHADGYGHPYAHADGYARADADSYGYAHADGYADADRDSYTYRCGDRDSCAAACAGYPDAGHSDAYANTYGSRRMRPHRRLRSRQPQLRPHHPTHARAPAQL